MSLQSKSRASTATTVYTNSPPNHVVEPMWEANKRAREISVALHKLQKVSDKYFKLMYLHYFQKWLKYMEYMRFKARREALLYHIIHTSEMRSKLRAYLKWKSQLTMIPKIQVALYIIFRYLDRKRLRLINHGFNYLIHNNLSYWRKRLVLLAWKNYNNIIEAQNECNNIQYNERYKHVENGMLLLNSIVNSNKRKGLLKSFNKWKSFMIFEYHKSMKKTIIQSKRLLKQKLIYIFIDKKNTKTLSNCFSAWKSLISTKQTKSYQIQSNYNISMNILNNTIIKHQKVQLLQSFNKWKNMNKYYQKKEDYYYIGINYLNGILLHITNKQLYQSFSKWKNIIHQTKTKQQQEYYIFEKLNIIINSHSSKSLLQYFNKWKNMCKEVQSNTTILNYRLYDSCNRFYSIYKSQYNKQLNNAFNKWKSYLIDLNDQEATQHIILLNKNTSLLILNNLMNSKKRNLLSQAFNKLKCELQEYKYSKTVNQTIQVTQIFSLNTLNKIFKNREKKGLYKGYMKWKCYIEYLKRKDINMNYRNTIISNILKNIYLNDLRYCFNQLKDNMNENKHKDLIYQTEYIEQSNQLSNGFQHLVNMNKLKQFRELFRGFNIWKNYIKDENITLIKKEMIYRNKAYKEKLVYNFLSKNNQKLLSTCFNGWKSEVFSVKTHTLEKDLTQKRSLEKLNIILDKYQDKNLNFYFHKWMKVNEGINKKIKDYNYAIKLLDNLLLQHNKKILYQKYIHWKNNIHTNKNIEITKYYILRELNSIIKSQSNKLLITGFNKWKSITNYDRNISNKLYSFFTHYNNKIESNIVSVSFYKWILFNTHEIYREKNKIKSMKWINKVLNELYINRMRQGINKWKKWINYVKDLTIKRKLALKKLNKLMQYKMYQYSFTQWNLMTKDSNNYYVFANRLVRTLNRSIKRIIKKRFSYLIFYNQQYKSRMKKGLKMLDNLCINRLESQLATKFYNWKHSSLVSKYDIAVLKRQQVVALCSITDKLKVQYRRIVFNQWIEYTENKRQSDDKLSKYYKSLLKLDYLISMKIYRTVIRKWNNYIYHIVTNAYEEALHDSNYNAFTTSIFSILLKSLTKRKNRCFQQLKRNVIHNQSIDQTREITLNNLNRNIEKRLLSNAFMLLQEYNHSFNQQIRVNRNINKGNEILTKVLIKHYFKDWKRMNDVRNIQIKSLTLLFSTLNNNITKKLAKYFQKLRLNGISTMTIEQRKLDVLKQLLTKLQFDNHLLINNSFNKWIKYIRKSDQNAMKMLMTLVNINNKLEKRHLYKNGNCIIKDLETAFSVWKHYLSYNNEEKRKQQVAVRILHSLVRKKDNNKLITCFHNWKEYVKEEENEVQHQTKLILRLGTILKSNLKRAKLISFNRWKQFTYKETANVIGQTMSSENQQLSYMNGLKILDVMLNKHNTLVLYRRLRCWKDRTEYKKVALDKLKTILTHIESRYVYVALNKGYRNIQRYSYLQVLDKKNRKLAGRWIQNAFDNLYTQRLRRGFYKWMKTLLYMKELDQKRKIHLHKLMMMLAKKYRILFMNHWKLILKDSNNYDALAKRIDKIWNKHQNRIVSKRFNQLRSYTRKYKNRMIQGFNKVESLFYHHQETQVANTFHYWKHYALESKYDTVVQRRFQIVYLCSVVQKLELSYQRIAFKKWKNYMEYRRDNDTHQDKLLERLSKLDYLLTQRIYRLSMNCWRSFTVEQVLIERDNTLRSTMYYSLASLLNHYVSKYYMKRENECFKLWSSINNEKKNEEKQQQNNISSKYLALYKVLYKCQIRNNDTIKLQLSKAMQTWKTYIMRYLINYIEIEENNNYHSDIHININGSKLSGGGVANLEALKEQVKNGDSETAALYEQVKQLKDIVLQQQKMIDESQITNDSANETLQSLAYHSDVDESNSKGDGSDEDESDTDSSDYD